MGGHAEFARRHGLIQDVRFWHAQIGSKSFDGAHSDCDGGMCVQHMCALCTRQMMTCPAGQGKAAAAAMRSCIEYATAAAPRCGTALMPGRAALHRVATAAKSAPAAQLALVMRWQAAAWLRQQRKGLSPSPTA